MPPQYFLRAAETGGFPSADGSSGGGLHKLGQGNIRRIISHPTRSGKTASCATQIPADFLPIFAREALMALRDRAAIRQASGSQSKAQCQGAVLPGTLPIPREGRKLFQRWKLAKSTLPPSSAITSPADRRGRPVDPAGLTEAGLGGRYDVQPDQKGR